jgi:acyl carrier protein
MVDILEGLQPIFRDVFEDDSLTVTRQTTADDVPEWDSLAHVNLIAAVEESFGVRFALGELEDLRCVGDMVDLIIRKQL